MTLFGIFEFRPLIPEIHPQRRGGPPPSEGQKIGKNFFEKFIFFWLDMQLYVSSLTKNHVFLIIPPSGTHLHLHFDGENDADV